MSDPYQVLGLARGAGEAEVKKAYRRLASQLHPDKNPGNPEAEERLKEVNRAYERIQSGDVHDPVAGFRHSPEWDDLGGDDLFSIFSRMGGFARRSAPSLKIAIPLTFEESLTGMVKKIEFSRRSACSACADRGASKRGQCTVCRGEGFVDVEDEVVLRFPAGTDTGQSVRGRSVKGGEVIGVADVTPDPRWERAGLDLLTTIHVSLAQLSSGEPIKVLTPYRKLDFPVPAGAVLGQPMRFGKQGVVNELGQAGDLIVRFLVEMPTREGKYPLAENHLRRVAGWSPLAS